MNCPNCGTRSHPGAAQCSRCGTMLPRAQQGYPGQPALARAPAPATYARSHAMAGAGGASLRPQAHVPRAPERSPIKEFLTFRRMVTPVVIQVIFWLGIAGVITTGLVAIGTNATEGVAMIVFGPLVIRIYCELLIVFFRINDHLNEIRENTRR